MGQDYKNIYFKTFYKMYLSQVKDKTNQSYRNKYVIYLSKP